VFRIDSGNSSIVFNDSGTDTFVSLTNGTYTGSELALELERRIEAGSEAASPGNGQNYSATYDATARKFSITNDGTNPVDFKWYDQNSTASDILGFEDQFLISSNINDVIGFDDGSGGAAEVVRLRQGAYTGEEMASELARAFNSAGGAGFNVEVTYNKASRGFNINVISSVGANPVNMYWSSAGSTAASTVGFNPVDTLGLPVGGNDTSDFIPTILINTNATTTSAIKIPVLNLRSR